MSCVEPELKLKSRKGGHVALAQSSLFRVLRRWTRVTQSLSSLATSVFRVAPFLVRRHWLRIGDCWRTRAQSSRQHRVPVRHVDNRASPWHRGEDDVVFAVGTIMPDASTQNPARSQLDGGPAKTNERSLHASAAPRPAEGCARDGVSKSAGISRFRRYRRERARSSVPRRSQDARDYGAMRAATWQENNFSSQTSLPASSPARRVGFHREGSQRVSRIRHVRPRVKKSAENRRAARTLMGWNDLDRSPCHPESHACRSDQERWWRPVYSDASALSSQSGHRGLQQRSARTIRTLSSTTSPCNMRCVSRRILSRRSRCNPSQRPIIQRLDMVGSSRTVRSIVRARNASVRPS